MSTLAQLKNAIENSDYEARSYSGRGMYGRNCLGITCENPLSCILDILFNADSNTVEDVIELLRKDCRQDNMGLDMIVYFPNIKWDEYEAADYYTDDEEEEENDPDDPTGELNAAWKNSEQESDED